MTEQHFADFNEKLTACFGDLAEFETKIGEIAEIVGIDLAEFEIDHLAVRVNTAERAEAWKAVLLAAEPNVGEDRCVRPQTPSEYWADTSVRPYADLLKESLVNGRPIALLDLHQPLTFCDQAVSVIELPFPKDKIYPTEGWEHIEIVVPMLAGERVEQWVERLYKRWSLAENLQIVCKVSEPKVEGERLPNPSIAISLRGSINHCTLKLHPYSIREICKES